VAGQAWIAAARIADLGPGALSRARLRLGPADRKRFARFRSAKRRREFLAGRALLQKNGSRFDSSPEGGIRVHGRGGASVSHARGWVACVVVASGSPGIDIEPMVDRDFDRLGRWAFGAGGTREEFYTRWTLYEARIKAFGDGEARTSHAERTWILEGRVALSVCVPRSSSRFSFSPVSRSHRASATRRAAPSSRSTATSGA
jgi:phosphopantetheinyl transferase